MFIITTDTYGHEELKRIMKEEIRVPVSVGHAKEKLTSKSSFFV